VHAPFALKEIFYTDNLELFFLENKTILCKLQTCIALYTFKKGEKAGYRILQVET
jgi:hypothetical protein